eukprot:Skav209703  [mRNA]  locus=scaffold36:168744:170298:+ [translate_table: standard]
MPRKRVAYELSPVDFVHDPNFQAASAWGFVQSNLKAAAETAQSLEQVHTFARTWTEQEPFEGKTADKHAPMSSPGGSPGCVASYESDNDLDTRPEDLAAPRARQAPVGRAPQDVAQGAVEGPR